MMREPGSESVFVAHSSRRAFCIIASVAVALVSFRAVVWILFEQAHFDSDQAVTGLMARHLAQGRAFPLFFYGQHYMLAVEAWLAAPLFWLAPASVTTLKLPLYVINIIVALVLLMLLRDRVGLTPFEALVSTLFFVLPPPITSSRLVEAQGGNVEPFLYVLLLWLLRDRALAFGAIGGFAFLHREFAIYAIGAIGAIDLFSGGAINAARLKRYGISAAAFVAVLVVARLLKPHADLLGPGTAGTIDGELTAQLAFWGSTMCFRPTELTGNLSWLLQQNLPVIFGWRVGPLGDYVTSGLRAGFSWAWMPLAASLGIAVVVLVRRGGYRLSTRTSFPVYLIVTGMIAAAVYAGLSCAVRDAMLIRYTLLTLYVPIGVLALFFASCPPFPARAVVISGVIGWTALSAYDHARVMAEYVRQPPRSAYRELAEYLQSQGVKYAVAPYWTAYQLDFLTGEGLVVASRDKNRVEEYQRIVEAHDAQAVAIYNGPGCRPPDEVPFGRWCVTNLNQARRPQ